MSKCLNCQAETSNPKFCNRSCSVSYNNMHSPKRKKKTLFEGNCSRCGLPYSYKHYTRSKRCDKCRPKNIDWSTVRLKDLHDKAKYQKSAAVRQLARLTMRDSNIPYECRVCKYSVHVEVSHKKSIKDFSEDTFISEINDLSNLEYLCRNHHWEFENGYLI